MLLKIFYIIWLPNLFTMNVPVTVFTKILTINIFHKFKINMIKSLRKNLMIIVRANFSTTKITHSLVKNIIIVNKYKPTYFVLSCWYCWSHSHFRDPPQLISNLMNARKTSSPSQKRQILAPVKCEWLIIDSVAGVIRRFQFHF